jgi:hypothetical protein
MAPARPEKPFVVSGIVHGHRMEALVSGLSEVLAQIATWTGVDPDAVGSWSLRDDYSEPLMLPVRRRAGSVNESRRSAHVVRLVPGAANGGVLTAVCGERLPLVGVDALPLGEGMPCERCLVGSVLSPPASFVRDSLALHPVIAAELDTRIG